MSRKMVGVAPSNNNDVVRLVDLNGVTDPFAFGVYPRVVWNGTSWPTRASSIPPGYTGNVEYWSPYDADATAPTDRITDDIWTRTVQ